MVRELAVTPPGDFFYPPVQWNITDAAILKHASLLGDNPEDDNLQAICDELSGLLFSQRAY